MLPTPDSSRFKPTSRNAPKFLVIGGCAGIILCVVAAIVGATILYLLPSDVVESPQPYVPSTIYPVKNTATFTNSVKSIRATIRISLNGEIGNPATTVSGTTNLVYLFNNRESPDMLVRFPRQFEGYTLAGASDTSTTYTQIFVVDKKGYMANTRDRTVCETSFNSMDEQQGLFSQFPWPVAFMRNITGQNFSERGPSLSFQEEATINGQKVNHYSVEVTAMVPITRTDGITIVGRIDSIDVWLNAIDDSMVKMVTKGHIKANRLWTSGPYEGSIVIDHTVLTSDNFEVIELPSECGEGSLSGYPTLEVPKGILELFATDTPSP